jgi:hypothetical protein
MFLALLIALAIIAGTVIVFVRALKTARASKRAIVGVTFGLIVAAALAIGIWFGAFREFQLSDHVRIQGVPIPIVVFLLEGENWTDFVKPPAIGYLCMAADALLPVGVFGLLCIPLLKRFRKRPTPDRHDELRRLPL